MEKKKIVRKVKPTPEAKFYPMVAYMKDYLRDNKPGLNASIDKKKEFAHALKCVKEMERIILLRHHNITKATMIRPCLGFWPIIMPLGDRVPGRRAR